MCFELPVPHSTIEVPLEDGAEIHVRRHGYRNGPALFLSHGNGFAIDGYFPFWRHLTSNFDLLLFDFRNHGQNSPTASASQNYAQLTRDLECILQNVCQLIDHKPLIGIFHSMSARTAMKHALHFGWHWDALVLFDPPNVPPEGHPLYGTMVESGRRLASWARRRRRYFNTVEELTFEYLQSPATARWLRGAHELMAKSVLRRKPGYETYELVCDPNNEAAIYEEESALDLWPNANEFCGPVKLIGCDPKVRGAVTGLANEALAAEGAYDYSFVADADHLLQIEKPEACVGLTIEFLKRCSLA
jgi:pimeloyl-ACP methyl ester carboxylesterase